MKKLIFLAICLLILRTNAFAEGNWESEGYIFSNVHAWQKGKEVTVSGRVSSGPAKNPLEAIIYVINDEGTMGFTYLNIANYSGKGELFEAKLHSSKKYKWWNIEQINVIGKSMPGPSQSMPGEPIQKNVNNEISVIDNFNERSSPKSYPKKTNIDGKTSRVLFTSFNKISVVIKDKKTNKLVMMKNISPHDRVEVDFPHGEYNAKIIGDGINKNQDFIIDEDAETIHLY
ncbi:MAG: hypothetical protein KUA37_02115 [Desulfomicrobium sp.]|nr:hypothetical protein [Pseudomonadota bacterium]MBV1710787.1 hypothetical protein [Desulfomicrobium sp.]MBU4570395.1 hypothetical protein [Pseudomonadota bacterium]MBU4593316.1 hypothetical protein [Pseudomonadota bacterium]MBV1721578.1 hypothetical protein [Desulfomicrobium sp.]